MDICNTAVDNQHVICYWEISKNKSPSYNDIFFNFVVSVLWLDNYDNMRVKINEQKKKINYL